MACVLMIAARLRAMHVDPEAGQPPIWAQNAMYVSTWALLLAFLAQLGEPMVEVPDRTATTGQRITYWLLWAARCALLAVFCGGVAAVVASVLGARAAGPS